MKNKVAIIGYGFVGKGMEKIFPDALVYDKKYENLDSTGEFVFSDNKVFATKEAINKYAELAIICVPTPPLGMGEQRVNEDENEFLPVDISHIEEVMSWLQVPLVLIKSTIPPGTTDSLNLRYGNRVCFSPEYMGEGRYYIPEKYPNPDDPRQHSFMIIGGPIDIADKILAYFIERLGPAKSYFKCSASEAECVKYMENTWGAMKVSFCNEWYELAKIFNSSYNTIREGFLLDSRVEAMHTAVFPNKRGFGGKCYPKDLLGIIAHAEMFGYEPKLLKQVWHTNQEMLKHNHDKSGEGNDWWYSYSYAR